VSVKESTFGVYFEFSQVRRSVTRPATLDRVVAVHVLALTRDEVGLLHFAANGVVGWRLS